MTFYSTWFLC